MKTKPSAALRWPVPLNLPALLLALALGSPAAAHAAPFFWDGTSTDNNYWLTPENWNPDGAPATDGTASLTFSGVTRNVTTNNADADTVFTALSFANDNSTGKTAPFTLAGNRITLGGTITTTTPAVAATLTDTISLNMIFSGPRTITANAPSTTSYHNLTVSGVISEINGAQGLTKSGGGKLSLTGANTYSGKTALNAGTLSVNSIGNVGIASSALGAPATSANGTIDLASILLYTGAAATSDRLFNLTGASSQINNGGSGLLTLTGGITSTVTRAILFRGNGNITETGLIAIGGGLTRTDSGTLTLTNPNNSFSGGLFSLAGVISVDSISNGGVPSALGKGTSIQLGQNQAGYGTLRYTGAGGGACDRSIVIYGTTAAGGIIENTVAGQTLALSGNVGVGGAWGPALKLQLIGAGNGVLSGALSNISNSLSVAKSGTGTWTLSGANTYTGTTEVTAGTLLLNGSTAAGSAVTVAAAGTLGGTGTVSGTVSAAAGAKLAPGNNTLGTLTLANPGAAALTLNGNTLYYEVSTNAVATSDRIAVSGTLVLNGANTLVLSTPFGPAPAGTYTLLTYAATNGTGTLALDRAYPNATLSVGEASVTLTVTGGGTADTLVWKGDDTANAWDTTTANWAVNGSATAYADLIAVLFDDTGSASPDIIITPGAVTPASVTVNTSTKAYTIGGAAIGGAGGLTKSGASTLTLASANTYSGGTSVSGGTLALSGSGTLGSASAALALSGGALDLGTLSATVGAVSITAAAASGDTLANGSLTGTSYAASLTSGAAVVSANLLANGAIGLTKSGAGTLVLSGTNTYTGATTVSAGTLQLGGASGTVLADASTISLAGGTFDLADRTETVSNFVVTGNAVLTSSGTGSGVLTSPNNHTPNSSSVAAGGTLTLTGGTLNETGYFVNNGTTLITGGTLSITNELLNGFNTAGAVVTLNSGAIIGTMISFGGSATCVYRFNGGTLQCTQFKRRSSSAADFFFNGVTVQARSSAAAAFLPNLAATAGQNAWISTGGVTFDSSDRNITASMALQHDTLGAATDGGLTKTGTGILTLSGVNTYNGNTAVSAGTLKLGAAGSVSNSPLLAVASNATFDVSSVAGYAVGPSQTLVGNGMVAGNVTLLGTLEAGGTNEVGILRATNFTFAVNSVVKEDCVNGSADLLQLSGGVTVETNVTVNLLLSGTLPARVTLATAALGITNPENLATWTVTGAKSYSRVVWDAAAQTIILRTPKATVFTVR